MTYLVCQKCGKEIDPGAAYCGNCGTDIQVQIETQQRIPPTSTASTKKALDNSGTPSEQSSLFIGSAKSATQKSNIAGKTSYHTRVNTPLPPNWQTKNTPSIVKKVKPTILKVLSHPFFWAALIGGVFIAGLVSSNIEQDTPSYGLQQYCNNLKGVPNYDAAYAQLGTKDITKHILSKNQFIASVKTIIESHDGIGDCIVNIENQYGEIAHGTITYKYGNGTTSTKTYEIFQARYQDWRIEVKDWNPTAAPAA